MANEFCLKMPDFHVKFRDLSHAVNLRHGTSGFTSLRKECVLRIFSPWKVRRLRPSLNPRTWVPKASTLPLDHRSRLIIEVNICTSVVLKLVLYCLRVRVFVCSCARTCFKASAYHCISVNNFGVKPAILFSEIIPKFKPHVTMVGSFFLLQLL